MIHLLLSINGISVKESEHVRERESIRKWGKHFQLTNSMEQSPSWEANMSSASQQIPRILCNLKVHYRIYNSLPPVPILRQSDPVRDAPSHCSKIHFNIIQSTPGSPKCCSSFRFPHWNPIRTSTFSHTCYMRCLSSSWLGHVNDIWWGIERKAPSFAVFSNPLLPPDIFLNILFSKTLPSMWATKFHTRTEHVAKYFQTIWNWNIGKHQRNFLIEYT